MKVDSFRHECLEAGIDVKELKPDYDLQEIQNSRPVDLDRICEPVE